MTTYQGTWTTKAYPSSFVFGDVWASIDFANKKAKFTIRYNGNFQHGTIREFESDIENYSGTVNSYIFNFKTPQNQTIKFEATNTTYDTITGNYSTLNPSDYGVFQMYSKLFDYSKVKEYNTISQSCTIL